MQQHGQFLKVLYWEKAGNKRIHTVWLFLYKILEQVKLIYSTKNKISGWLQWGGERRLNAQRNFLVELKYSTSWFGWWLNRRINMSKIINLYI